MLGFRRSINVISERADALKTAFQQAALKQAALFMNFYFVFCRKFARRCVRENSEADSINVREIRKFPGHSGEKVLSQGGEHVNQDDFFVQHCCTVPTT